MLVGDMCNEQTGVQIVQIGTTATVHEGVAHLSPSAHTEKLLPCSAPPASDPSAHSQSQNSRASAGGTPSPCIH
jgi:hypothetical protein